MTMMMMVVVVMMMVMVVRTMVMMIMMLCELIFFSHRILDAFNANSTYPCNSLTCSLIEFCLESFAPKFWSWYFDIKILAIISVPKGECFRPWLPLFYWIIKEYLIWARHALGKTRPKAADCLAIQHLLPQKFTLKFGPHILASNFVHQILTSKRWPQNKGP